MSPKVEVDNPAGRLYSLMEHAQRLANESTGKQFSVLLNYQIGDQIAAHLRFAAVLSTIQKVGQTLQALDESAYERFLEARPTLVTFFADGYANSSGDWNTYKRSRLKEADLRTLSFCSMILSRSAPEVVAKPDNLKALESELEALYQSVLASDLDFEFKTKILDGLFEVKVAIHQYHITGARGIEKAVSMVAATGASASQTQPTPENSNNKLVKQFWSFVEHANSIFTFWTNLELMAPGITRQLTSGITGIIDK